MWQWNFARSYILIKAFKNGLNQFYSIFSSSNISFKYVIPTVTLKNSWLLNDRGVCRQNGRPCTVWAPNQVSGDVIFDAFLLLAIVLSSPKLFIGSHSPPSCCVSYHIFKISEGVLTFQPGLRFGHKNLENTPEYQESFSWQGL